MNNIFMKHVLDFFFKVTPFFSQINIQIMAWLHFFFNNSKAIKTGINNSSTVTFLILKDSEIYCKHNPI